MKPNDTFNYCHIPEFSRYYFITDKKVITTSVVEISLHEDVLQTWSQYILQQEGVVLRNEFEYDSMLIDENVLIKDSNTLIKVEANMIKAFPDFTYGGEDSVNIILKTAVIDKGA